MEDAWVSLAASGRSNSYEGRSREQEEKGSLEGTDNSSGIGSWGLEKKEMENSGGGWFRKRFGVF